MSTNPPPTSSSTPPPPPAEPAEPTGPRRLTKSSSDRRVAGVAAGIAEYFGIDPTIVRLLFVASVFLGGFGIIAYLIGWVVLPVDDGTNNPAAPHTWGSTSTTIVAVGLLVAGAIVAAATIDGPFDGGVLVPLAVIAGGVFLLLQRPDATTASAEGPAGPARPATPPPGGTPPATTPSPPSPGTALAVRTEPVPTAPADRRDDTDTVPLRSGAKPPAPLRAPGPPITSFVLSTMAIIGAIGFLVDAAGIAEVSATVVLALCLAAVGLGLLAAARWGGGGGLIILGILTSFAVMIAAVAGPALDDGVGAREYQPTRFADVRNEYRHGIGAMRIDLGGVDFPAGRHRIEVHLGIGQLELQVPRDVRVAVDGELDIGQLGVFGKVQDGVGNDITTTTDVATDRVLVLDVDAGIGNVDVHYARGGSR